MPVNLLNESDLNKYLTSVVYTNNEEVPHWVSDKSSQSQENLQNPDWVKEHKDEVVKAILLQYFKKRIREYFMKSEDVPYLESVKSNEKNLPEWCQKALSENKSVFKFDEKRITSDLKEKIITIRDYLYAMADKYVVDTAGLAKKTEKISKIHLNFLKTSNQYATFENVLSAAELWHEKLAISSKKVRKNEEFYKKSLEGTKFIMELPNNTFAYQLLTPNALDFEGDNMGHCVGRGYYDDTLKKGTTKIYSIRDENGESHVTFEVRKDDDGKEAVYQCKGKQNKAPVQKYMDVVQAFIEKMDLDIEGDFKNIGLLKLRVKIDEEKFESKFYSIQSLIDRTVKIPDGTVCDGDINLKDLDLKVLPDLSNLILIGSFDCSYNQLTSLDGAPEKVGGDFECSDNQLTSLEGAPKEVGGFFECSYNQLTSLEGTPEKVGGSFYCSENQLTSLKGAPKEVGERFTCSFNELTSLEGAPKKIGENFYCENNKLTSLEGAPEKVGGSFYCSENQLTSLKGVPKEVGGDFECKNNKLTSLDGVPKKIGKKFDCSDNKLTSLKGAPKEVVGDFYCSYNRLTSLEGAPEEVGGGFYCGNNKLTSLDGAPKKIGRYFNCAYNELTSLKGAPKEVGERFTCSFNELTSLEGAPEKVGGSFYCSANHLTSLKGAPKEVGGDFECSGNKLTSLDGAPEEVGGRFDYSCNPIETNRKLDISSLLNNSNGK